MVEITTIPSGDLWILSFSPAGESADDDDDDEDEEDEDTEEVHHHKKHHKAHLKYRHHALKKNKVKNHTTKHSQKVTLGKSNF